MAIFPWIEAEEAAYKNRQLQKSANKDSGDAALQYLINLLHYLRLVLIQDCAVLYSEHPDAPVFRYAPFNTDFFRSFALGATQIINDAEEHRRQHLQNLPMNIQDSFRGSMESNRLQQIQHQKHIEEATRNMSSAFGAMCGLMQTTIQVMSANMSAVGGSKLSRKRKAVESMAHIESAAQNMVALYGEPLCINMINIQYKLIDYCV